LAARRRGERFASEQLVLLDLGIVPAPDAVPAPRMALKKQPVGFGGLVDKLHQPFNEATVVAAFGIHWTRVSLFTLQAKRAP
jgi:hypothetical protein